MSRTTQEIEVFSHDYKDKNHYEFSLDEIWDYLEQKRIIVDIETINIHWGIINTLLVASVFDDKDAVNDISQTIDNILYPQHTNP